MRSLRITTITAASLLALAACGEASNGTADKKPAASTQGVDCESEDLSQAEWTEKCADKAGSDEKPDTDLKVGQTFIYKDGLKVTVDSIKTITDVGEFDDQPEPGKSLFRVNVTFDNGSKKPVKLDEFGLMVVGATKGGDAKGAYVEKGMKEITGRLAPGVKDTKNSDYTLNEKYGKQVVVTINRFNEDMEFFAKDPEWTGPIR